MHSDANDQAHVYATWYISVVNLDPSLQRFKEELAKGVRHFFVALPNGYRHVADNPRRKDPHNQSADDIDADGTVIRRRLSFLEVRQPDLELLAMRGRVSVAEFGQLALYGQVGKNSEDLSHVCLRRIPRGRIEPGSRTVASRTPHSSLTSGVYPTVLREPAADPAKTIFRLDGVTLLELVVVDKTLPPSSENPNSMDDFGIRESSPIIFALIQEARRYSHTESSSEVDRPRIEAKLQELERSGRFGTEGIFRERRRAYAARLADPHFRRKSKGKVVAARSKNPGKQKHPIKPNFEPSLFPPHLNPSLARAIYAARCWSGQSIPRIDGDKEQLLDLLVQLGFNDASGDDEVQSLMYFITGEKPSRKKTSFFHDAEVRSSS